MRKTPVLAAALLMSTTLAVPSFAQSPTLDYPRKEARDSREAPSVNQLTAFDDARIAKLKATLQLTSDQDGYWGKLESALKDISKRRADRVVSRWDEERDARDKDKDTRDRRADARTPIERMRFAAENMTQRAAELKSTADAAEPLYDKLDDQQRRVLDNALREQVAAPVGEGRGRYRRSAEQ